MTMKKLIMLTIVAAMAALTTNAYAQTEAAAAVPVTGCPEVVVEAPRATGGAVVRAADFGLSTSSTSNAAAISRALDVCRAAKASRLELAPGTYRCFDEPGIAIRDFTDFTFDGKGAVLVFRRPAEFRGQPQSELVLTKGNVLVQRCTRTEVRDFTMDWDWESDPLGAFVRVVGRHEDAAHPERSFVDLAFVDYERHPKYPEPVPLQKVTPMDESRTGFRRGSGEMSFGQTEGHFGAKNAWVAPNVLRVWPGFPMEGRSQNPMLNFAPSPAANLRRVRAFETNGLYRVLHCYYGKNGINLDSNVHFTMRDVNVWSCFGMALVIDGRQHNWLVDGLRVMPPDEAAFKAAYPGARFFRRPVASTSDGHHVARSQGSARYENCRWTLNNDDSMNFHDRFTIAIRVAPRVLDVINRRGAAYFRAERGATLELRRPNYAPVGEKGFRATLVRTSGDRLYLDRDVPEQVGQCFLVWDRTYGTDRVSVKNCVFEDSGLRNLFSSSDLTIEGCVFRRTAWYPIRFIADYRKDLWCEGMGMTNLVVRNCLFEDVNRLHPQDPCISAVCVTPPDWKIDPPVDPGFVAGGLLVEGCRFVNPGGYVLDLSCGRDIAFRDNVVELGPRAQDNPAQAGKIRILGEVRDP